MSLVDEAVQAATAAYVSSLEVPDGTRLLNLRVYFDGDDAGQLAPPSVAVPGRVDLDEPDAGEHPALVALLEEVNQHEDDEDLLEEYFAALALSLHRALGVVVVVSGLDVSFGASPREQLGAQLSDAEWAEWKANGWLPRGLD
jgi:hypothetical protein